MSSTPDCFSSYVQQQYTFYFEKFHRMGSALLGSGFINVKFHGQIPRAARTTVGKTGARIKAVQSYRLFDGVYRPVKRLHHFCGHRFKRLGFYHNPIFPANLTGSWGGEQGDYFSQYGLMPMHTEVSFGLSQYTPRERTAVPIYKVRGLSSISKS